MVFHIAAMPGMFACVVCVYWSPAADTRPRYRSLIYWDMQVYNMQEPCLSECPLHFEGQACSVCMRWAVLQCSRRGYGYRERMLMGQLRGCSAPFL
eukprot:592220-Pelagomonas_calceolata.AAC.2